MSNARKPVDDPDYRPEDSVIRRVTARLFEKLNDPEDSGIRRVVRWFTREVVTVARQRGDASERDPCSSELPLLPVEPSSEASLPELCRPSELAAYLRLSERSIYEYIRRRELPGVRRIGRSILIHSPTVLRWLADGQGRVLRSTRS